MRSRSRRIAHSTSRSRIDAALARSRASPSDPAIPASSVLDLLGVAVELVEAGPDGGDELVIVGERQGAGQAT